MAIATVAFCSHRRRIFAAPLVNILIIEKYFYVQFSGIQPFGYEIPVSLLLGFIGALIILRWGKTFFVITPQQHAQVLEIFGRYTGYRTAGLSIKFPWPFQRARKPFSLQTQQIALQLGVK